MRLLIILMYTPQMRARLSGRSAHSIGRPFRQRLGTRGRHRSPTAHAGGPRRRGAVSGVCGAASAAGVGVSGPAHTRVPSGPGELKLVIESRTKVPLIKLHTLGLLMVRAHKR